MTTFQHEHPGGSLIKQGAGGDVGAFWDHWTWHHMAPKVGGYLEKLRVGALADPEEVIDAADPYSRRAESCLR